MLLVGRGLLHSLQLGSELVRQCTIQINQLLQCPFTHPSHMQSQAPLSQFFSTSISERALLMRINSWTSYLQPDECLSNFRTSVQATGRESNSKKLYQGPSYCGEPLSDFFQIAPVLVVICPWALDPSRCLPVLPELPLIHCHVQILDIQANAVSTLSDFV